MQISNATELDVFAFPQVDKTRRERCVVAARSTYCFKEPGRIVRSETTRPFNLTDVYYGSPKTSSLRYASDLCHHKPQTDIYFVDAIAFSPTEQVCEQWQVNIQIGSIQHTFVVTGKRKWYRSFLGTWKTTQIEPCDRVALLFENAFGGTTQSGKYHAENPVGKGILDANSIEDEVEIPQLVSPEDVRHISGGPRPLQVVGVTPLAPGWQPRLGSAGTYDHQWQVQDWPNWPADFSETFFNCAPRNLRSTGILRGGEQVALTGLCRQPISFPLPPMACYLAEVFTLHAGRMQLPLMADTLIFDLSQSELTVVWRASFHAEQRAYLTHISSFDET